MHPSQCCPQRGDKLEGEECHHAEQSYNSQGPHIARPRRGRRENLCGDSHLKDWLGPQSIVERRFPNWGSTLSLIQRWLPVAATAHSDFSNNGHMQSERGVSWPVRFPKVCRNCVTKTAAGGNGSIESLLASLITSSQRWYGKNCF